MKTIKKLLPILLSVLLISNINAQYSIMGDTTGNTIKNSIIKINESGSITHISKKIKGVIEDWDSNDSIVVVASNIGEFQKLNIFNKNLVFKKEILLDIRYDVKDVSLDEKGVIKIEYHNNDIEKYDYNLCKMRCSTDTDKRVK